MIPSRKLGLAIAMGEDATSHTQTFLEAVQHCLAVHPAFANIEVMISNDRKCRDGGKVAASELLRWGAEVIVGHYSSAAALGALSLYRDRHLPVLLPAATSIELEDVSRAGSRRVYRYQRSDAVLLEQCICEIRSTGHEGGTYFLVEDTVYGEAFRALLTKWVGISVIGSLRDGIDQDGFYVVLGHDRFVMESVGLLTASPITGLVLLDDAYHPGALQAVRHIPKHLFTLVSRLMFDDGTEHRPFWNESRLALATAANFLGAAEQASCAFRSFDENGLYSRAGYVMHALSKPRSIGARPTIK
ncbi:amino acid ABC transporter substrate-binding protein [Burkholderia ubonensis]|nr:hypothetical protein CJO70_17445 [Burkholderia ubonensis]PAJ93398.1 hypothetical protein CJO69_17095 [Burkholderia ubonensis]PAK06387.1 hypothetical protein CJO67_18660 [Burkholderia ubonensis]PAK12177.1 hypothetical protein CJO66_24015 [Burkholderia ubonensis]RQP31428.1 amino acid ABC transporter substrate-binding protein [Burkholderia ubonensis]